MKVRTQQPLSAKQKRAMDIEIRRQCVEITKEYEVDLDTIPIYILHKHFGFGKKRIEQFYKLMHEEKKQMKERFASDQSATDESDIDVVAMRFFLKQDGIDVQEMYDELEDSKFIVKFTK